MVLEESKYGIWIILFISFHYQHLGCICLKEKDGFKIRIEII
jgi:hypothetical protein